MTDARLANIITGASEGVAPDSIRRRATEMPSWAKKVMFTLAQYHEMTDQNSPCTTSRLASGNRGRGLLVPPPAPALLVLAVLLLGGVLDLMTVRLDAPVMVSCAAEARRG